MNKKEIKIIMEDEETGVCYGSLAYCCSFEKKCGYRDKVIKKIGLTRKQFLKLKGDFDKSLFKLLKGGKHGKK